MDPYYDLIDYFLFQLEEGQLYRIAPIPGTMHTNLYDADGQRISDYGMYQPWQPPSSGEYYFEITAKEGVAYRLKLIDLSDIDDDHGNSPEDATSIAVGQDVAGAVDEWFDVDYFRFQAEEGQLYRIDVVPGTLPGANLYIEDFDEWNFSAESSEGGRSFVGEAPGTGYYWVSVGHAEWGTTGTYTLTVTATPTPEPTPAPVPTMAPTAESSPTRTPEPRSGAAAAHISQYIPWFHSPPDAEHSKAKEAIIDIWLKDSDLGDLIAKMQWVSDGIDGWVEGKAIRDLADLAEYDLESARIVAEYPWVTDGTNGLEQSAFALLGDIAKYNVEFARAVAASTWVADGIDILEQSPISSLAKIAARYPKPAELLTEYAYVTDEKETPDGEVLRAWIGLAAIAVFDRDFANAVAAYPWANDGIKNLEGQMIMALANLAEYGSLGLARTVATYPWVTDEVQLREASIVYRLRDIARVDLELANALATSAWIEDGIGEIENQAVQSLSKIATYDSELANAIAAYPWFEDGIGRTEVHILDGWAGLVEIGRFDHELADSVAAYPWMADGIDNPQEASAVQNLARITSLDSELARVVAAYPWVMDGIDSKHESGAVGGLSYIALRHLESAYTVAAFPWVIDGISRREQEALDGLAVLVLFPSELAHLWEQPWFTDGLLDEEAAFISLLPVVLQGTDASYYSELLATHYTRASSILLPLTGVIDVTLFGRVPLHGYDDVLIQIEEAVRFYDTSIAAFPCDTIDVLLLDGDHYKLDISGFYFGCKIMAYTGTDGASDISMVLYHELAHSYFDEGPVWFFEGAAEFLASLVLDKTEDRKRWLENVALPTCRNEHGDLKLSDLSPVYGQHGCPYEMGEHFLYAVSEAVGLDAVLSALRDTHLQSESVFGPITEEEIYETFLAVTPHELTDEFRDVYRRLHGGPYAHPEK